MPDRDEVLTRLQRVNDRLQTCWTQRSRLDEEITDLQTKRDFLLSLAGDSGPTPAASPTFSDPQAGQVAVSASRLLPQVYAPTFRVPERRISSLELLQRARVGVDRLQDATHEVEKATQSIGTTLDIARNVINLVSPEGRRQLAQIAQGLFGALSGAFAPPPTVRVSTSSVGDGQSSDQGRGVAAGAKSPDILGFLAYATSPAFFEMLSSFIQPRPASETSETTSQ